MGGPYGPERIDYETPPMDMSIEKLGAEIEKVKRRQSFVYLHHRALRLASLRRALRAKQDVNPRHQP